MPQPDAKSHRILLADDEPDLLQILRDNLSAEGYAVETASNGEDALISIRANPPDLAILDLRMPRVDGFGVVAELRKDPVLQHLPVIVLSASGTQEIRVEGLDLGADDFIAKPVDLPELKARVRMILRRTREGLDANPLTRLPGNVSIETRIEAALDANRPLAVLYIDLNQFKAYNDSYGYDAGDRVIKATGKLLLGLARAGGAQEFVGHIGGDDFILLTTPDRMETLAKRVISEFDALAPSFYKEEDRKKRKIVSTDRQGRVIEFPLLSVAIGICHNAYHPLSSYAEVSQIAAELKRHAKAKTGSALVVDRRRD